MKKEKTSKKTNKANGKSFVAKNRVIIGVIMLVFAIVFGMFVLPKAVNSSSSFTIYQFKENVKQGTTITLDMLTKTKTTDSNIAKKAYASEQKINEGCYVSKVDILAEDYLLKSNVNSKDDGTGIGTEANMVPEGKQIISVPVGSIYSAVSYKLISGDVIRFYSVNRSAQAEYLVIIPTTLQYVKIYDVYDGDGISCSVSGARPSSISLIVTAEQAADIVEIISTTDVYFSLMSSGNTDKATRFLAQQDEALAKLTQNEDMSNIIINPSELEPDASIVSPTPKNDESTTAQGEDITAENTTAAEEVTTTRR